MLDGNIRGAFTPREERHNVVLQARIRANRGWSDACILNLSPKGMLVYSPQPAKPGSVVEVRRGEQAIVARVVWRQNNRIGLRSQDRLEVEQVITGASSAAALQLRAVDMIADKRKHARDHDNSRVLSRMLEFASITAAGAVLAFCAYALVAQSLLAPFTRVIAELSQRQG